MGKKAQQQPQPHGGSNAINDGFFETPLFDLNAFESLRCR